MPAFTTTHRQLPYLFFKRNTRTSQENCRTGKRESFLKKSRGILRKRSRFVVYRFLDQYKKVFGLRWLLRKFQLSPNAYYNYLKQRKSVYQEQKNYIQKEIKSIYYNNNRLPGHRSMGIFLQRKGIHLSKTTAHKYMNKDLSLHAIVMRKKTKYRREVKNKIFSNLLKQDFRSEGKNRIWCTDFTYIRLSNGKMRYNCSILDLYDRSIVASVNGESINTKLAKETLEKALKSEKPKEGLILHSGQGCQYTSWEFVSYCREKKIIQSMSKAGCPYDNAPMERFYNTLKNELIYPNHFYTESALDEALSRYVFVWYNHTRPHSYNDGRTPFEARTNR